jgi:hypothetical protein
MAVIIMVCPVQCVSHCPHSVSLGCTCLLFLNYFYFRCSPPPLSSDKKIYAFSVTIWRNWCCLYIFIWLYIVNFTSSYILVLEGEPWRSGNSCRLMTRRSRVQVVETASCKNCRKRLCTKTPCGPTLLWTPCNAGASCTQAAILSGTYSAYVCHLTDSNFYCYNIWHRC